MKKGVEFTVPLPEGIDVGHLLRKEDGKVNVIELGRALGCRIYINQETHVAEISDARAKWFKGRDAVITALGLVPFYVSIVEGPTMNIVVGSLNLLGERHGCILSYSKKNRAIRVVPIEECYAGRKSLEEDFGAIVSNSTSMTIEKGIDLFIDCRAKGDDVVEFEPGLKHGFVHPKIILGPTGDRDVGKYPSNMVRDFLQGGNACKEGGRSKLQFRVGTLLLTETPAVKDIGTVSQLQKWIQSQKVVKRRFVTGVKCQSDEFSYLGEASKECVYSVTLKKGQTQVRVTLVDLAKTDVRGRNYLIPDLGNGLALKSCYECDNRSFSIECWNASGYDVRVQLQFDKLFDVGSVIQWVKLAKVVQDELQLPPKDKTAFVWDRTRAKLRNRYVVGDVIFDIARVRSTSREEASSETKEIELSSSTFHDWARSFQECGVRQPLPEIDWDLFFDSAWHISERIQEQTAFLKAQRDRWWHCAPRDESFKDETKTELLKPNDEDMQKVVRFYQMAPVDGKELGDVRVIYNKSKSEAFRRKMLDLQVRHGQAVFNPSWQTENLAEWRRQVFEQSANVTAEFLDRDFPNVRLMPVWHGTKSVAANSIVNGGFAALQSTDEGFFGKGLYFAAEPKYSYKVYGEVLLFCWVGFFSAYPVIDGDRVKLQGKAAYKSYDAHFVPVGIDYNPLKPNQKQVYTELVVFENMQCLPLYRVELKDCAGPAKLIGGSNVFVSENGIDLMAAAKFCYATYLSKPYILGTIKYDWEFNSVTRPNHGLPHTLRTMAYVPFVVQALKQHYHKAEFVKSHSLDSIALLQLGMLFYVAGRENEAGSRDDLVAYGRFRRNSAAAFAHFVKVFKIPSTGFEKLVEQSIVEGEFETSAVHCVMRIAHDIDCLRCQPIGIYDSICVPFHNYLSAARTAKLRSLVLECTLATGDRIMGHDKLNQSYDTEQFLKCSKSVDTCVSVINAAVSKAKQLL